MSFISLNEAEKCYKISKSTLKKKIEDGIIKAERIGEKHPYTYLIPIDELERLKIKKRPKIENISTVDSKLVIIPVSEIDRLEFGKTDKNRPFYAEYIHSKKWKEKAFQRLKLDNFQCQRCHSAKNLTCHHVTYDHLGNEPMEDLVTLCKECHRAAHEEDLRRKRAHG